MTGPKLTMTCSSKTVTVVVSAVVDSPKESKGEATLYFRPGGAKADQAIAAHGNWSAISISLEK